MAVVAETGDGYLLNHERAINNVYSKTLKCQTDFSSATDQPSDNNIHTDCDTKPLPIEPAFSYVCKRGMFHINEVFMMDSQFEKIIKTQERDQSDHGNGNRGKPVPTHDVDEKINPSANHACNIIPRRKKRKRKVQESEEGAMKFHSEVCLLIEKALSQLISLGEKASFIKPADRNYTPNNNKEARELHKTLEGPGDKLAEMCDLSKPFAMETEPICVTDDMGPSNEEPDLFNTLINWQLETLTIQKWLNGRYLIPPKCSFLMSDVSFLDPLLSEKLKYDLIIADPPWPNKSVKRKKVYKTIFDLDSLLDIPVKQIASEECLVAVWVTNKRCQQDFVKDNLFPEWSVKYVAQWYWLKITTQGKPVYALDSTHGKRPYESLLLGRFCKELDSKHSLRDIPDKKVLISVPCCIHSRKPPLDNVLEPYIKKGGKKLELFARNLQAGWTSWGNEVLKYQHMDYFEERNCGHSATEPS